MAWVDPAKRVDSLHYKSLEIASPGWHFNTSGHVWSSFTSPFSKTRIFQESGAFVFCFFTVTHFSVLWRQQS